MQKKMQLLKWAMPLFTLLIVGGIAFSGTLLPTKADSADSCQLTWNSSATKLTFGQVDQSVIDALQGANLTNCTQPYTSCTLVHGFGDTQLNFDNILTSSPTLVSNLEHDDLSLNCNRSDFTKRFSFSDNGSSSSSSTDCVTSENSGPDSDCNTNTPPPQSGSCQLAWIDGGGGDVDLDASQVTDQGLQQTLAGYNLKCADDANASSSCTLVPGENDSGDTDLDLRNVQNRSPWIYGKLVDQYGLNCNDNNGDD